ncbi:MAG: ABC transporter permease, partial [Sphingobacteriaceae bacterium]
MIKNYFTVALRSFWRHRYLTLINIIGLSTGITAAVVIYLIVQFNFDFNKFQPDSDRIYRVVTNFSFAGETTYNSGVTGPLPKAVNNEVTGIDISAPFQTLYQSTVLVLNHSGKITTFKDQENIILADKQYFKLFHYRWLAGSPETALDAPNQVVLSSEQAKKYFPSLSYSQMEGRTVTYDSIRTTVAGVVEPLEGNTDLTFHDFISYKTANNNKDLQSQLALTEWGGTNSASQFFIRLTEKTSVSQIEKQLDALSVQWQK